MNLTIGRSVCIHKVALQEKNDRNFRCEDFSSKTWCLPSSVAQSEQMAPCHFLCDGAEGVMTNHFCPAVHSGVSPHNLWLKWGHTTSTAHEPASPRARICLRSSIPAFRSLDTSAVHGISSIATALPVDSFSHRTLENSY